MVQKIDIAVISGAAMEAKRMNEMAVKLASTKAQLIREVCANMFLDSLLYFQDLSNDSSYSTFRRTLNALRYRITRKGHRTRPPDKFNDKFSIANQAATNQQQQQQQQLTNGNPSDGVYSRLSFDPSLPSYYRVT